MKSRYDKGYEAAMADLAATHESGRRHARDGKPASPPLVGRHWRLHGMIYRQGYDEGRRELLRIADATLEARMEQAREAANSKLTARIPDVATGGES